MCMSGGEGLMGGVCVSGVPGLCKKFEGFFSFTVFVYIRLNHEFLKLIYETRGLGKTKLCQRNFWQ